jgi:hypothetical protein
MADRWPLLDVLPQGITRDPQSPQSLAWQQLGRPQLDVEAVDGILAWYAEYEEDNSAIDIDGSSTSDTEAEEGEEDSVPPQQAVVYPVFSGGHSSGDTRRQRPPQPPPRQVDGDHIGADRSSLKQSVSLNSSRTRRDEEPEQPQWDRGTRSSTPPVQAARSSTPPSYTKLRDNGTVDGLALRGYNEDPRATILASLQRGQDNRSGFT